MIVISNPIALPNEIEFIHALFEAGLERFHIRKPDYSEAEMRDFINAIGLEYRSKLVLHSQHLLAEAMGIEGIHFTEKERINPVRVQNPDRVISTSVHSIVDFNSLSPDYDYAFLSPVFDSISKSDYKAIDAIELELSKRTNFKTKLIALGGISSENIRKALNMGFDDVALLGSIWNSEQPIENFKQCQQIVLSY